MYIHGHIQNDNSAVYVTYTAVYVRGHCPYIQNSYMYVHTCRNHRSLSSINNKRLQGAFAYLRQFRFDLMYRKSADMRDVDALSQAAAAAATGVSEAGAVDGSTVLVDMERIRVAAGATDSVAQVDLAGYWGFDTVLKDMGELQRSDDEVVAIRQLMGGKKQLADIEVVPLARDALAKYLSMGPKCENFVN